MNIATQPLISVVIVNYNRRDDLRQALESVCGQYYSTVEIIVVDNASTDGSLKMLNSEFPDVQTIRLEKNIGMDGYSVACRAAKGEFLFQMDNDSLMPDPTVLSAVVAAFQTGPPDLAIIATHVEEYQASVHSISELRAKETRQGPLETFGYHSGGVGFRKALIDQVGYYNKDVFLYGAELFVQMKALAAGFRIHYHPEILMLHKSSGVARSSRGVYYEIRNRYWFMRYFGLVGQQLRFIPAMLLHDLVYMIYRRSICNGVRAVIDAFGRLPESLVPPLRSAQPSFQAALCANGRSFGVGQLFKRIQKNLWRKIGENICLRRS
jgi:GT2 family glycosyltransferase